MRLPWTKRPEIRESSFTDALVTQIVSMASGNVSANPNATGALESAAGVVARAFASAEVSGPSRIIQPLTPDCLALIGRALIRSGEIVLAIDIDDGMVKLWPVADFDITGGYMPESWQYRLNLAGPSRYYTRNQVMGAGVCHFRYLTDPERPWHGQGPIESAALAGKLSAETLKALADESSGPRGSVLPIPNKDGQDATLTQLRADLRKMGGSMSLVESMASGWQGGEGRRGGSDWEQKRIGAQPTAPLVDLQTTASKEVLMAVGIPPSLFDSSAAASAREGWRQCLHGVIQPLARIVETELQEKMDPGITLSFDRLMASDLQGRARAFQSMVNGGMDVSKAAGLSGLMEEEAA